MEYLKSVFIEVVNMSIVGSLLFSILLFLRVTNVCTTKWLMNFFKINLLIFVLPLSKIVSVLINILKTQKINHSQSNLDYNYIHIDAIPNYTQTQIITREIDINKFEIFNNINSISILWFIVVVLLTLFFVYCRKRFITNILSKSDVLEYKIFNIDVLVNSQICSPILIGIKTPKIILPKNKINGENFNFIIAHELQHYYNKDLQWKAFVCFIKIIHWFNPMVYFLANEFENILEFYCDEQVSSDYDNKTKNNYAKTMLDMCSSNRFSIINLGFANNKYIIKRRLINMLNASKIKKTPKIISIIISVVVMSLTSVTVLGDTSNEPNLTNVVDSLDDATNDANHALGIIEDSVEAQEMVKQKSLPVDEFTEISETPCTINFITTNSQPIKAIATGEVIFCGYVSSWGVQVRVKQNDGYIAIYSHLPLDTAINIGDTVEAGEAFAMTGNTGNTEDIKCKIELIETDKYVITGSRHVENDKYDTTKLLDIVEIKSYLGINNNLS